MVSIEKMRKCHGKNVLLTYNDGTQIKDKCICYLKKEEDYEEPSLEFTDGIVNQSEIKSIEILDY